MMRKDNLISYDNDNALKYTEKALMDVEARLFVGVVNMTSPAECGLKR